MEKDTAKRSINIKCDEKFSPYEVVIRFLSRWQIPIKRLLPGSLEARGRRDGTLLGNKWLHWEAHIDVNWLVESRFDIIGCLSLGDILPIAKATGVTRFSAHGSRTFCLSRAISSFFFCLVPERGWDLTTQDNFYGTPSALYFNIMGHFIRYISEIVCLSSLHHKILQKSEANNEIMVDREK